MWASETDALEMTYGDARQQLRDALAELGISITDLSNDER